MALTKVTRTGITNDAVNDTKIADNSISEEHLDATAITGHTELAEAAAGTDILLVYDASAGTIKKIQASNVGLQAPTVSSVSPTSVTSGDGTGNYTFTITGSGFTGASASLINNSGTSVNFDTVTVDSDTQITGVIAKSSLPGSGEPYDIKVTSSNNIASTLENQINIDQSPTYNTSSGTLGTIADTARGATTLTVEAFDPESAGNVTFELQSGSLPAGASITTVHENGVSKANISGFSAVGSNTTSNFVLRAVDAASNTSSRAFSITVNAPQSTSFTASGTFTVPTGTSALDVLVIAGAGGGGTRHGGGGGAGGLVFMPDYPVTPGATVTVTVGCGGAGATWPMGPAAGLGVPGQDSVFGTITAKGGGGGGFYCGNNGLPGGSGGGGGPNSSGGTATQPTQPGNSGAYGFGNAGGQGLTVQGGGGGGGGAGAAGAQATYPSPSAGGNGGAGKAYTIADGTTPVTYAGGGGGGGHNPSPSPGGFAGSPGGGDGGATNVDGQDAAANTGLGGGGGGGIPADGGNGGKGIVIVRY